MKLRPILNIYECISFLFNRVGPYLNLQSCTMPWGMACPLQMFTANHQDAAASLFTYATCTWKNLHTPLVSAT